MEHTGYTPGPWGYAEGVSGDLLVWSGNRHVATAYRHTADAVLIADAPRLAEENERLRILVTRVIDDYDSGGLHGSTVEMLRNSLLILSRP